MSASVAQNTMYLTVASIGQKILAFVYFLFLARTMGSEQTGGYFLALSITTIFSTITDFGITPVIIRDIAKHPERAMQLVSQAMWFKIPFMAIGAFLAIGSTFLLGYNQSIRELVMIACLIMLADALSLLFYGVLRGHHALRFESLGIFVGQLFTLLFGGTVLLLSPSLHYLIGALLIGSVFNMLFSAQQVIRLLGIKAIIPYCNKETARKLLMTAIPFALAGIFVKVYSYVDSILISIFLNTAAVGVYALAYKFTYAFQFLPMAFVAALYPGMSALVSNDPKRLKTVFDDALWYMMVLATPITFGLFVIAKEAIALAGSDFSEATVVLQILIFVLIPIFLDFPVGSLLNAADRQSTKTAIMGVTMVINVIFNVLLVPTYGLIGAAISAVISFYFLFFAGLVFIPKIIPGYRIRDCFRTILPIGLSGVVMGVVAMLLKPVIGYQLIIPLSVVVYIAMLFLTRSMRVTHLKNALAIIRKKPSYEDAPVHD